MAEAQGLKWGMSGSSSSASGCTSEVAGVSRPHRASATYRCRRRSSPFSKSTQRGRLVSGGSSLPGVLCDLLERAQQFARAVRSSEIAPATIHDLRLTFAVPCAQAGVPLPRIQKLLGHASLVMTMRYMKHAPEAYFVEDAARIAASIQGTGAGVEQEARAETAQASIRLA